MTTAIAIRHVAFEDLGLLEALLLDRGIAFRYLDAGVDEIAPHDIATGDLLIVLGGPIGACDEAIYPFLSGELRAIEAWLGTGKPILGICLGAQLIARALGARVYPARAKEIGFAPITLIPADHRSPLNALSAVNHQVLHWHGDTFDLPQDAELLASTDITANQAFRIGNRVLALQFHIEADISKLERWLIGHTCELADAAIDIRKLRADGRRLGCDIMQAGVRALGQWLDDAEIVGPGKRERRALE